MTKVLFILAFLWLPVLSVAQEITKSPLKVLYVGGSPNYSERSFKNIDERKKDVQKRMDSFEITLNRYFAEVTVLHASDYTADLSAKYDVTVMDGIPKSGTLNPDYDPSQWMTFLNERLDVFPPDFDKPVLFIGEVGNSLGVRNGLKFDWYCLCLEGDALGMKLDHAIFQGPFSVDIPLEKKNTPSLAKSVDYKNELPDLIDMWTVQTKSCTNETDYRPGLVSHFGGFEDSPEAEVISGGVSAKDITAVALARHGSYFHWGFSGAPDVLTPTAQTVLANAISYIAKFDGTRVLARKFSDRVATTKDIELYRDLATPQGYAIFIESERSSAEQLRIMLEETKAKKQAGEPLNTWEERLLKNPPTVQEVSPAEFLKRYQGDLFDRLGDDFGAYERYYAENMPYFYSYPSGTYVVDEDLKQIGIAKNDHRLLDYAIALLENNQDKELAYRILHRYTLLSFTDPQSWRLWYENNKERLFFTESGGYCFLVDSNEEQVVGNDYEPRIQADLSRAVEVGATSNSNPILVSASKTTNAAGFNVIVVKFNIHPGYHIYADVSEKDPFIETKVTIELPGRTRKYSELAMARPIFYNEKGTTVYKDEAVFVQEIVGQMQGEAICKIIYQVCNNDFCFPPVEKEISVNLGL